MFPQFVHYKLSFFGNIYLYIKVWANTNTLWKVFFFFVRRFYTLYEQKCSNLSPLLSITFPQGFRKSKKFGHWTSEVRAKRCLNGLNKFKKKSVKKCRHDDFTPFMSKNLQIWDFFPTLFPKDPEIPKSLDIGLQEVGAKIPTNCVLFHSNSGYSKE